MLTTYEKSFWASLYTSFPLLAAEIGDRTLEGTRSCVLGCSDGKFVIPLAAAGSTVTCVDIDPIMLWGGAVVDRGKPDRVVGLKANLEAEGLADRATIIRADFLDWRPDVADFDYVVTSGSWAYNRNLTAGLAGVVGSMTSLVGVGGYYFADYLLPHTSAERENPLYPDIEELARLFPADSWRTVNNDDVGLVGEAHYPDEYWHYHRYGALLVQRLR